MTLEQFNFIVSLSLYHPSHYIHRWFIEFTFSLSVSDHQRKVTYPSTHISPLGSLFYPPPATVCSARHQPTVEIQLPFPVTKLSLWCCPDLPPHQSRMIFRNIHLSQGNGQKTISLSLGLHKNNVIKHNRIINKLQTFSVIIESKIDNRSIDRQTD